MAYVNTQRAVLVTGGAGFIGSHLVDSLLASGIGVRVLDDLSTGKRENLPPNCELVLGDVADPQTVARVAAGMGGIFHLAAIASVARANEEWSSTHRVNAGGTVAVLEAARANHVPVVYASSAAVYGDTGTAIASENRVPAPRNAYGADKLASELHAQVAANIHGIPTVGLRFFNVYGPRQDPASPYSGVISIFARRIAAGLPVTLHGDGGQTRDFVFVHDVVAHLRAAMHRLQTDGAPAPHVLNVCTGRAVSVRELTLLLGRLHGVIPPLEPGLARSGDIRHSQGSPDRAMAALHIRAEVVLEDGLKTLLPGREGLHYGREDERVAS
jgi:UDP-glucose 4-epimerase